MTQTGQSTLVIIGAINYEYGIRSDTLPTPDVSVIGDLLVEEPGGKGANQAVAAVRLGAQVSLVGRVSSDIRGDRVLAQLLDEGVDTQYVVGDDTAVTGVTLVLSDKKGNRLKSTMPGANEHLSADDVRLAAQPIAAARAVLAQHEVPLAAVTAAFRFARAEKVMTIFDPDPSTTLPDDFLALVDVMTLSSHAAHVLSGITVTDAASARRAAQHLRSKGVKTVAVEAGEEGRIIAGLDGEVVLPRIPVQRVDTTGEEDAFTAALAVALAEGQSLAEAGRFANAASALATTLFGAHNAMPRRESVEGLLKDLPPAK